MSLQKSEQFNLGICAIIVTMGTILINQLKNAVQSWLKHITILHHDKTAAQTFRKSNTIYTNN